jgi:formylmethanofuran dehydrogenase subunit E
MVYVRLNDSQIEELIQHLNGSSLTLDNACQQLFDCGEDNLTVEQLEEIDQQIFQCETCGWWFERGEQAEAEGDFNCEQCATE